MFHADGQTDMTKLIIDFRSFANPPKNEYFTRTPTCILLYHAEVFLNENFSEKCSIKSQKGLSITRQRQQYGSIRKLCRYVTCKASGADSRSGVERVKCEGLKTVSESSALTESLGLLLGLLLESVGFTVE